MGRQDAGEASAVSPTAGIRHLQLVTQTFFSHFLIVFIKPYIFSPPLSFPSLPFYPLPCGMWCVCGVGKGW